MHRIVIKKKVAPTSLHSYSEKKIVSTTAFQRRLIKGEIKSKYDAKKDQGI